MSNRIDTLLLTAINIVDRSFRCQAFIRNIPAFSYGVVYKDRLIFGKNYGYADVKRKTPVTENTCFRIASISKTFTATAIMQLVEKNKLKLDDRVIDYLSWFMSHKDKRVQKITIRQLLTHTSGVSRDGDTPHWVTMKFPTIDQIKDYISTTNLSYEPNEKWKYSNLGYAILGEVIAAVTGQNYEDYIRLNIFSKLEMNQTSVDLAENVRPLLAIGYGMRFPNRSRRIFSFIPTNAMAAATGFTSCVVDLGKFISAQFAGNHQILTEESKRELKRIQWLDEKDDVNQMVGFRSWRMNGQTIYSHSGGFQGFKTIIAFDCVRKTGIVILTNAIDVDPLYYAKIFFHTTNYVLTHHQDFVDKKITQKKLVKYEGTFINIWGLTEAVVINHQLVLFASNSNRPLIGCYKLKYLDGHRFLAIDGPGNGCTGQEVRFKFNRQGQVRRVYMGATPSDVIVNNLLS